MQEVLLSTTVTAPTPLTLRDLNGRQFNHPEVDVDLLLEFTRDRINNSTDLQAAIVAGYVTLKDENGVGITDVSEVVATHGTTHTNGADDIQDAGVSQKGLMSIGAQIFAGLKTFNTPIRLASLNTGDEILTTDIDGDVQESGVKVKDAPAGGSGFTIVEYAADPVAPEPGYLWVQAVDANTKKLVYYNGTDTFSVDLTKD